MFNSENENVMSNQFKLKIEDFYISTISEHLLGGKKDRT